MEKKHGVLQTVTSIFNDQSSFEPEAKPSSQDDHHYRDQEKCSFFLLRELAHKKRPVLQCL